MSFWRKLLTGSGDEPQTEKLEEEGKEFEVGRQRVKTVDVGSSGTEIYAGYLSEEYLEKLRGTEKADIFDKMRRSEPKCKMVSNAMKSPIKSANWEVHIKKGYDEDPEAKQQQQLIEHIILNPRGKSWEKRLHEHLSLIDFGYSLNELTFEPVLDDPDFGSYNGIRSMSFRSQRTIERWNIDEHGDLDSVTQYAFGDHQRTATISAEHLMHFSVDQEGDNFEGISVLRPAYGPFLRKNKYLKLIAAGLEKYAIPIPQLEIPKGQEDSEEYKKALKALKKYTSNQCNYLTVPEGWKLTLTPNDFDASKIREIVEYEDSLMASAALASFLELGQRNNGGSYNLGDSLSEFFLGGLLYVAGEICETYNYKLIPKLVGLNFASGITKVQLNCSGIDDKAGEALSKILNNLTHAQIVRADDKLEDHIRKRFDLPERDESTMRDMSSGSTSAEKQTPSMGFSENIQLAEGESTGVSKDIEDKAEDLSNFFREELDFLSQKMIDRLVKNFDESNEVNRFSVPEKLVEVSGVGNYRKRMKEKFSEIFASAVDRVRKEYPTVNLQLAEIKDPKSKRKVMNTADVLTDSQLQDVAKGLQLTYLNKADEVKTADDLRYELNKEKRNILDGNLIKTGALVNSSNIINSARRASFKDFEDEVESYTWVNGSPVADICKYLSGKTIPADHPDVDRYWPGLHHNCKTYVVANLKSDKERPETLEGFSPSQTALKSMTL